MQTLQQAIARAKKISRGRYPEETFVVYSIDEEDIPGNNYHVCFEYDLQTFYAGCDVLYCSEEG